jgi:uncharacterized SAM-binding protein YcdF (DUF218 family)
MSRARTPITVATALVAALGWIEWKTWRASTEDLPPASTNPDPIVPGETVLVLGCPRPRLHRWRVRIAMRSTDPATARFVFCGGAVYTEESEAQMMAEYARHTLGLPQHNIVLEDRSTTTVENIVNSIPLLGDVPVIKIASNTFHARRARRILDTVSPQLAGQLVRARDYIPFEGGLLHAALWVHEAIRAKVAAHSSQRAHI